VITFLILLALALRPEPPLVVTYEEFRAALNGRMGEAERKYKGRLLEVTGTVHETGAHPDWGRSVTLYLGKDALDVAVVCYLRPEAPGFSGLRRGQRVTVRGRCESAIILATLRDCELVP
jgi:hypothetical protein